MIFYFSATGNSLAVAQRIAKATGDELTSIGQANREGSSDFVIEQGSDLGFVFPVCRFTTPPIIDKFIREARFTTPEGEPFKPGYVYAVMTYMAIPGKTGYFFDNLLQREKGFALDACFGVQSVGNCVYLFSMPDEEKERRLIETANNSADEIGKQLAARAQGHHEKTDALGTLLGKATAKDQKPRSTKSFHVLDDRCTGCGTCVRVCPTNSIHMENGHPVWEGDSCTDCLACLHHCPTHASQYGKSTIKRGRYLNPVLKSK